MFPESIHRTKKPRSDAGLNLHSRGRREPDTHAYSILNNFKGNMFQKKLSDRRFYFEPLKPAAGCFAVAKGKPFRWSTGFCEWPPAFPFQQNERSRGGKAGGGLVAEMSPPGGTGGLVRAGFVNCGNANTTIIAGGACFKSRFTQPSDAPTMGRVPARSKLELRRLC
jgi:hypothetical protein